MAYTRDQDNIFRCYLRVYNADTRSMVSITEQAGGDMSKTFSELTKDKPEMTPETYLAVKKRITRCVIQLYMHYPFFGLVAIKLKTVITYDVPTMAVDNVGNIYINPDFCMNQLSEQEVMGVLAHEAFHIMNFTFFRQMGRHHKLWNVATDFIMNRDILDTGLQLPKMGCLPTKQGDRWIIKGNADTWPLPDIDVTDMTDFALYDILLKTIKEKEEKDSKGDGSGKGEPGGAGKGGKGDPGESRELTPEEIEAIIDELSKMQEELDKHLEAGEAKPTPVACPDPSLEEPQFNPDQPMNDREAVNKILQIKARIDQEIQRRGLKVNPPRSFDPSYFEPKTNWKQILRKFITIGSGRGGDVDYTKPAKRAMAAGYYGPRTTPPMNKLKLVVAVDSSGSIPSDALNVFYNELRSIMKTFPKAELLVLFWHTKVWKQMDIKSYRDVEQLFKLKQLESGGNDLSCVKHYCEQKGIKDINGILVLTDGYVWTDFRGGKDSADYKNPLPPIKGGKKPIFMLTVPQGKKDIEHLKADVYIVDIEHK